MSAGPSTGYVDVPASLAAAVAWGVEEGVFEAPGPGRTSFNPSGVITRRQLAVFLWRLAGRPQPGAPCSFADVASAPAPAWLTAACWSVGDEVMVPLGAAVGGVSAFSPDRVVSRAGVALSLFRLAGSPPGSPASSYRDVPRTAGYAAAVDWLVASEVVRPAAQFQPTLPLSRGRLAQFLFDLASRPGAWAFDRLLPAAYDCDVLDTRSCLLPFPSDRYTTPDPTMDSGRRVAIARTATPANVSRVRIDPTDVNRNDGFSPGSVLLTFMPGVDLVASGAAPVTDIARSVQADSPVIIVNAATGEPHPHWVEYDTQASTDDARLLSIVPARNFEEGARYLVALRNLVDGDGNAIIAGEAFGAIRDAVPTEVAVIEARRPAVEAVLAEFAALTLPGSATPVDPGEFVLAWDFTVASERNLTERVLHLRNDAFAGLGDNAPSFTARRLQARTLPATDPRCTRPTGRDPSCPDAGYDPTRNIIDGTITVPNYQSNTTLTGGKGGAPFRWGPDGLPQRNPRLPNLTAAFRCVMPQHAVLAAEGQARISMYGHGLLGSHLEVGADHVKAFADEHNVMFCATSWHGFSANDFFNVIGALEDLSTFSTIADGGQQGLLHQMFLGRLMLHPQGLRAAAPFRVVPRSGGGFVVGDAPLIDVSSLGYDGNSQGGIMGGALVAVSPDIERGVLGVPGMNYSILLYRSSDWDTYATIFNPAYPNEVDRLVALGLAQIMWDRIETNGYAHHLDPADPLPGLPGTPATPKTVMLHVAYADHQVAVVTADNLARTANIPLYDPPALFGNRNALWPDKPPGDNPDVEPFWGIRRLTDEEIDASWTGPAYVMWDSGNTPPPPENVPPGSVAFDRPDVRPDPHERPRRAPGSRAQKYDFLFNDELRRCPTTIVGGQPQELCLAPFG